MARAPLQQNKLDLWGNEVKKTKLLTKKEETDLFRQLSRAPTPELVEKVLLANQRLVVKLVMNALAKTGSPAGTGGHHWEDLCQEGAIGLLIAIESFRLKKECRLSTFATWWIRELIRQAIVRRGHLIRLPDYLITEINRVGLVRWKLSNSLQRDPTCQELAEAVGLPKEKVNRLEGLRRYLDPLSLDDQLGEEPRENNGLPRWGLLEANDPSPAEDLEAKERKVAIQQALSVLSPREKAVLELRFGLNGKEHQGRATLETISRQFNLSREMIRQIEKKAIQKLRSNLQVVAALKEYL